MTEPARIGPPRRPCPHPSPDDECRACRIERRAHNNAADVLTTPTPSRQQESPHDQRP